MTTLSDRPKTALLVIDVQNGVVARAPRRDEVVANIATLVEKGRAEDGPVLWLPPSSETLPTGSAQWQYAPELVRNESEPVLHTPSGDSFEATDLETRLA